MIDLSTISPLSLPSVSLEERSQLPNIPCIYFVLEHQRILYIGKAVNLLERWKKHARWYQLKDRGDRGKDISIAWMECSDVKLLYKIERILISHFCPELNERISTHPLHKVSPKNNAIPKEKKGVLQNRIKRFVDGMGISVYQFWKETGISRTTAYNLYNIPEQYPAREVMDAICTKYGIQPGILLEWVPLVEVKNAS